MKPVYNSREVADIPGPVAAELKHKGGDVLVYTQLQQLYRIIGTPKTSGLIDYHKYPFAKLYKSKFCASKDQEVECRCRLQKIIGISLMSLIIFIGFC